MDKKHAPESNGNIRHASRKKSLAQAKHKALDAIHTIEDSALDAYHTIEDHNAAELRQDVKGFLTHLADWIRPRTQAYKSWYLKQPVYLKVLYGLTVLPVVAVLSIAVLLLIKFGGPVLLALLLGLKFAIAAGKVILFIGYIVYKILKTLLMWYYTISRLYLGGKAKRKRFAAAADCQFPVTPPEMTTQLSFNCRRKELYITRNDSNHTDNKQIKILFSYLRYALLGQLELFNGCKKHWRSFLTLWRQDSRETLKTALAPVGASLFSPHTLGANINKDRVLVPGDAILTEVIVNDADSVGLKFDIFWVDWKFKFRKSLKPLVITREHQQMTWHLESVPLRPISWDFSAVVNQQVTP